ncbi:alpha-L-fucosidase [Streptomyces sp. V4I8]|uniref:alpha-L-fucosidase n=1 Tax=Streptomyces sp. V4I8 TaxID=3156469 RepID=UPI0035193C18
MVSSRRRRGVSRTWKSVGVLIPLALLTAVLIAPLNAATPTREDDGARSILDQKYGLFVHHVPGLTTDSSGAVVHDANALADSFDAGRFADDLASAKVQYVIFTAWHAKMVTLWPSQKMLDWDLPDHRVNRDLISDMITAVKAKGIHVYLYTHPRDGAEFTAADQVKTGWGTAPSADGKGWHVGADFNRPKWNHFINDIYQELMQRYGNRIDGLFMDEGSPEGDSQTVVDYPRLRNTIKAVNPRAVLIQNYAGNQYGLDIGMKEQWGYAEFGQPNGDLWPGFAMPVDVTFTQTWWAKDPAGSLRYSPASMFRYTVLQAATSTDGGGTVWAAGPFADEGWEPGVMPALRQVGTWIDPIRQSIFGTRPSTSYPTNAGTRIADLQWGVATRAPDDRTEYIHVLKPPTGQTLTLPAPQDGKTFEAASLVKDGTPVKLSQDANGVKLTIPGAWDANDTAIKLTVKELHDWKLNDNAPGIKYHGSWNISNDRGANDYQDDIHHTTANGDSFSYQFTGTGVDYISSKAVNYGDVKITITDAAGQIVTQQTVSATAPGYRPQQTLFSVTGLPHADYTISAAKHSGDYLQLDALRIRR